MPRKSTVEQLPEEILEEVQKLIRDGHTIDAITEHLHGLEQDVSRSAVGRYTQNFTQALEKYKEAQEVAGVWVEQLGENSKGDVGKLIAEMLKTIAFNTLANMGEMEGAHDPKDIMFLAKSIKDLEGANKLSIERELKIREEVAKKTKKAAADTAVKTAKSQGLSAETVNAIRSGILGISE